MVATLSAKQLAHKHDERRKLSQFAGALMTSGSFTMMASGGNWGRRRLEGRELNNWGGSLLTSGSFTMMASSGSWG